MSCFLMVREGEKQDIRWWLLATYLLFAAPLTYIIWRWPYTPEDVISDFERLGPWAFLCDLVFIIPLIWAYREFRKKRPKALSISTGDEDSSR
jgi:hypothetical protein